MIIKKYPLLYGKSKGGKTLSWNLSVTSECVVTVEYGYVDGKKQITGTKSTTNIEQAIKDADSLWKRQIERKGYREKIEDFNNLIYRPMLAHKYNEAKLVLPCFIQPKLNGVRCIAVRKSENDFIFISRKGLYFNTLNHLVEPLKQCMKIGDIYDGEIYIHGVKFQTILSLLKKYQQGETEILEYWVYDMINEHKQVRRLMQLKSDISNVGSNVLMAGRGKVFLVPTKLIKEKEDIKILHNKYSKMGFEGIIIRNINAKYLQQYRSYDLLKYKLFLDAEFKIIGYEQGKGNHSGCIVFKCVTKQGKEFNVTPKFSLEERKEMWNKKESYIGKLLTVKFQELSKDKVPIFPVGIAIRDYE